jgi:hypothetical protein
MAQGQVKISGLPVPFALPAAATLTGAEFVPMDQTVSGVTKTVHATTAQIAALGGGGSLKLTDGTNTVTGVTQITVSGATVGGTSPNATLTITGGGVPSTINDLVFWWKGDDIPSTVTNGNYIPCLRNDAPAYPNAGAVVASEQQGGTLAASALNGINALSLAGTGQQQYNFQTSLFLPKVTIFIVLKTSATGGDFIGGGSNCLGAGLNGGSNIYISVDNVALIGTSTSPPPSGSWCQLNFVYNSTTGAYAFRQGSAANGSGTSVHSITTANTSLFWNAVTSGTNFPGEIAEYIIYNRDLTLTQIQSVESYLNAKWGV